MKRLFPWISIAVVVGVLVYFFSTQQAHAPAKGEKNTPASISAEVQLPPVVKNTSTEMIEVTAPLPGATLTSPMTVTGRARGPWYFEASFPIELRDTNNVLIAKTVAQAQGDWMTEDFVPFTATLTFPPQPAGSQGVLTFKNDNPSGEPQNSMMFDVPVVF